MTGKEFVSAGNHALQTSTAVTEFSLAIATESAQTADAAEWQRQLPTPMDAAIASDRTAMWWNQFWNRSWISVTGDTGSLPES